MAYLEMMDAVELGRQRAKQSGHGALALPYRVELPNGQPTHQLALEYIYTLGELLF